MCFVLLAVGAVAAAGIGALGATSAAGTQASADQQAAQTQLQMFQTITGQEQPFLQSGYGAESMLNGLLGISGPPQVASSGGASPGNPYAFSGAPYGSPYQPIGSPTYTNAAASPSAITAGQIAARNGVAQDTYQNGGVPSSIQGILQQQALQQQALSGGAGSASPYAQSVNSPAAVGASTGSGSVPGTNLPYGYLTQTFNPTQQQLQNYPGYQFQLSQGDLALQAANSPTGSALSGSALKQLSGFNQGLAASNYNNYFNQFQTQQTNIFNRLSNIAGLGQNAAGNLGNQGAQLGTGIAGAQAAAGAATAGGIVGATNSIGNGISNAGLYSYLAQNQGSMPGSSAFGGYGSGDPNSDWSPG
jgi:hypothetical protein